TDFGAVFAPGGVLVLHLLDHDRLLSQRLRTLPPVFRETPEGDRLFVKVLSYPEDASSIVFDFLTLTRSPEAAGEAPRPEDVRDFGEPGRDAGGWEVASRRSVHTALPVSLLAPELASARFIDVRAYGDHSGKAFDPEEDESVILTATFLQDERP
ncbi:MAG: hypothetical protein IBX62_04110, partial [Coriobacteriia bacterium]|nr:hypothetical protein [Coriobacteriia bacterium]